jgi:hypothetical protein
MTQRMHLPSPAGRPLRSDRPVTHPTRRQVAVVCAVMCLAAVSGVVGLAGGGIDFGPEITARLPWHSPVIAAVALGLVVAGPMGVAAVLGWWRSPRTPDATILAGLALVGWIVVETAVIRTVSWLQPACLAYGGLVMGLGLVLRRNDRRAGGAS